MFLTRKFINFQVQSTTWIVNFGFILNSFLVTQSLRRKLFKYLDCSLQNNNKISLNFSGTRIFGWFVRFKFYQTLKKVSKFYAEKISSRTIYCGNDLKNVKLQISQRKPILRRKVRQVLGNDFKFFKRLISS